MIDLTILKPIALATMLASGAAGTGVATGVLDGANAQVAIAGATRSMAAPAASPTHRARPERANGDRMELRVRALVQRLDLTDAQVAQLRQILASKREAARAIRELPPTERGAARRALMQSTRAAIAAVLTPEQQAAFRGMQSERRERPTTATGPQRTARENGAAGRARAAEHRALAAEHRARAGEHRAVAADRSASAALDREPRPSKGNRPAHAGPRGPRAGR